ncbi:MAG: hypothetical protein FJ403_18950 [Verrucomicrobia bacterium]|nr:hypothetical protein [Verrucomicrobiota bacterium]
MKKAELEHLLRAASTIAKERDFILFGSQAIWGLLSKVPKPLSPSLEADIYPKHHHQAVPLIVRSIGPRTPFFDKYGYYADCVAPELGTLPDGWTERLIPFRSANMPRSRCCVCVCGNC